MLDFLFFIFLVNGWIFFIGNNLECKSIGIETMKNEILDGLVLILTNVGACSRLEEKQLFLGVSLNLGLFCKQVGEYYHKNKQFDSV